MVRRAQTCQQFPTVLATRKSARSVVALTAILFIGAAASNASGRPQPVPSEPHPAVDLESTAEAEGNGLEGLVGGPFIRQTNQEAYDCAAPAIISFLAFLPGSLTWGPVEYIGEVGVYLADLVLKHCAPQLTIPPPIRLDPNIRGDDGKLCYRDFTGTPAESADYENMLGIDLPRELLIFGTKWPDTWGPFGDPEVEHFNTGASVELDPPGFGVNVGGQDKWRVPVGRNQAIWTAQTRLSILDLIWIPIPGPFKVDTQQTERLKWELAKAMAKNLLQDIAIDYGLGRIDDASQAVSWPISWPTAENVRAQEITIWDVEPPTLELDTETVELIAFSPGGAHLRDHRAFIDTFIHARDECDRLVTVTPRGLPDFFKVDVPYDVTWVARDRGPKKGGGVHEVSKSMRIIARDIMPPDINPPKHRVVISDAAQTQVDIGWPQVFDAVDLEPKIFNDAPALFPQGVTEITWWAKDQSGNESRRVIQRVNVKRGNSAPQAVPRTGANRLETRTWEELTVPLEGFDPDPQDFVNFEITDAPDEGFFHAPLYPAFVEDYRVESNKTYDELKQRCQTQSGPWHAPFPYDARHIDVADDGTTYVLDRGDMFCQSASKHLNTYPRLAVFDAEGQLKTRSDGSFASVSADPKGIWIDKRAGRIYLADSESSGYSVVNVYDLDVELIQRFRIDYGDPPPGENPLRNVTAAVADHARGIMYVTNRSSIWAFRNDRVAAGLSDEPVTLGVIDRFGSGSWYDLEIDSHGNVYASDYHGGQVRKYSASTFNADGTFIPGSFVGWKGKCVAQLTPTAQPVCDVEAQTSVGFTCTDDLCDPGTQFWGEEPGQFQRPRGLAMSPDDVLYVVDTENDRIQRFTPDGYWAGQAKSTCEGVCFVLGAFNAPRDITVNSDHFYILDTETNLLHVSKTTPIEIEDGLNATVTYQSDYFFEGLDSFSYRVHDGLAASAPARVDIQVGRGQRPPEGTTNLVLVTDEDRAIELPLTGFDPDGIGVTFELDERPASGSFTTSGSTWIYTPAPDFHGVVNFSYVARDQDGTSLPGHVEITVRSKPDVPAVDIPSALVTGRGFPWSLKADFVDPDPAEQHRAFVDWGDGTGGADVPIGEDNDEGPFLNAGLGRGTVTGRHTYQGSSDRTVRVCITDKDDLEGCADADIDVRDLIDLEVLNTLAEDLEDASGRPGWSVGDELSFTLRVANRKPEGWAGLIATNLVVDDTLGPGVRLLSVRSDFADCGPRAGGYRCTLLALPPGTEIPIDVRIRFDDGGDLMTISDARADADQTDAAPSSNAQQIVADVAGGTNPPPPPPPSPSDCDEGVLCLQDGRFEITTTWQTRDGETGDGTPVSGSADSGLFWFFGSDNWEILVKVLDGCAINGSHWVLAASTTDVGYTLTVRDTETGQVRRYTNQIGTAAPAIIDVNALGGCNAAATVESPAASTLVEPIDRPLDGAAISEATRRSEYIAAQQAHQRHVTSWLQRIERLEAEALVSTSPMTTADCIPGGTSLCLAGNVEVSVDWRAHNGDTGQGRGTALGTADSGLFWFFQESNWEMLVKVLDACAINGHKWFFAAATTDVEFSLELVDAATGRRASYTNPLGNAADAIIDIQALPCS